MGIFNAVKHASKTAVRCGESFDVTLSLSASPNLQTNPKEICLVLDRSGSMKGKPLDDLKAAVKKFLDILDIQSDGIRNKTIGADSQVAIVSFQSVAAIDVPLTSSVRALETYLDGMTTTGSTNHRDAILKGTQALSQPSGKEKLMIIFTDGNSNQGQEGYAEADAAKAQGITIYSIGYAHSGNLNPEPLRKWASSPSAAYTMIAPTAAELEAEFIGLVQNINKAGATDIKLTDTVNDCFDVTAIGAVSKGTARITGPHTVEWTVDSLGKDASEGAECTFTVRQSGRCTGPVDVNRDYTYTDAENNQITLLSPQVDVTCITPPAEEPCPEPHDITVGGCTDAVEYSVTDVTMSSLGRIVQLNVQLKQVCPRKQIALAVTLTETDAQGKEHPRGMKTLLVPAHTAAACTDVTVRCIKFVLPEDLDETGSPTSLCNTRHFKARCMAHYTDTDFVCCE